MSEPPARRATVPGRVGVARLMLCDERRHRGGADGRCVNCGERVGPAAGGRRRWAAASSVLWRSVLLRYRRDERTER